MKICILQNTLVHYRLNLFAEIHENFNTTVICNTRNINNSDIKDYDFKIVSFDTNKFKFNLLTCLYLFRNNYDVIIVGDDLKNIWLPLVRLISLKKIKFSSKWVFWGVPEPSKNIGKRLFRKILYSLSDILVFYDYSSYNYFCNIYTNMKPCSLVALNTVGLLYRPQKILQTKQFSIINVGSLAQRKKNDVLLRVIASLINKGFSNLNVKFVGEGAHLNYLKKLSRSLNINAHVKFIGQVNDYYKIKNIYGKSHLSVSYGQAGLSVLQSFGHGIPFITSKNAISGGELTNIIHGYNGFIVNSDIELESIILKLMIDKKFLRLISKNARNFYEKFCTINHYSKSFSLAVNKAISIDKHE